MKRILALILAILMVVGALVSCDIAETPNADPEELHQLKGDKGDKGGKGEKVKGAKDFPSRL